MSNYTVVELDGTTIFCHNQGTYTIKTYIEVDDNNEVVVGFSPGNSLYPEYNLRNNWYIVPIKIDNTYI